MRQYILQIHTELTYSFEGSRFDRKTSRVRIRGLDIHTEAFPKDASTVPPADR